MKRKSTNWDTVFKEIDHVQQEKKELEAQVAIMRDALIQSLYALESLKDNPSEWNELAERALTSVTWVLSSDAGHEFLDSYVRMQKALMIIQSQQILNSIKSVGDKDLH